MDWNKSKIILIIAFLIINVFLLAEVVYERNSNNELEIQYIDEIYKILGEKGIEVDCEIPEGYKSAPFMELEFSELLLSDNLIKSFLPNFDGEYDEDVYSYSDDTAELSRVGKNKLVYEKKDDESGITVTGDKDREKISENFCLARGIDMTDFEKESTYERDGCLVIEYKQKFEGFFIESSYRKFYFKNFEVVKFEMQTVGNIFKKAEVDIISPYDALVRVIVNEGNYNKTIIDMKACYYNEFSANDDSLDYFDSDLVWKVTFDDGSYCYLNEVMSK